MPSIIDQLKAAGITIPDGLTNEVLFTSLQGATEFEGLANKNKELLSWKAENKPLLDSLTAKQAELEEANRKALEEKEQLAIQNKDYETLAQINADKLKKLEDGLNASRERTQKAALEAAQASVASLMSDPIYGKYYAEKSAVVELNDIGEPITKFKFGEQVFDSLDDWKSAAIKDESIASKIAIGGEHKGPSMGGNGQGGGQQAEQKPKLSSATQGYMANLKP